MAWSFLLLHLASADCLTGSLPQRVNLSTGVPLSLSAPDSSSGRVLSAVFKILIEERLGFSVVSELGDARAATAHVALEQWADQRDFPSTARNLGNSGYFASRSMYLTNDVQKAAFDSEGLPLEFYLSYRSGFHQASSYFTAVNLTDPSLRQRLKACEETRLASDPLMRRYLELTGDAEGTEEALGAVRGKCLMELFWAAPRCRSSREHCFMFFTGGDGWHLEHCMQRATAYHLPLVLAVAKTIDDYRVLPRQFRSIFYWWVPDDTFLDLNPTELIFPPHDAAAHRLGDFRTASEQISVDKYVSQDLRLLAPGVEALLRRFSIDLSTLHSLLQEHVALQDADAAACRWLTQNQLWQSWLPTPSDCVPSYGLFHPLTDSFVLDPVGLTDLECRRCSSGTFSQHLDGSYVCASCPAGSFSSLGATSCELCPEGSYQELNSSSTCEKCGVGSYQDLQGQSGCKDCPRGTTSHVRSVQVSDCGCREGSINLQGQCVACDRGLRCPFASSLDALLSGSSELGSDFTPRIEQGYHSKLAEPLEIYQCRKKWHCPGQKPGECAGGRTEIACAQCPEGQMWMAGRCNDCNAVVFVAWGLGLVIGFMLVTLTYYLLSGRVYTQASLSASVSMVIIVVMNIFQIFAIIGLIQVEWPEEVEAIFKESTIFILDLDDWGLRCFVGSQTFNSYVFTVALIPVAQLWLVLMGFISRLWKPWPWPKVTSSMGSLLMLAFITTCNVAFTPFMCYSHPSGARSVVKYPEIFCSDAGLMQTFGLLLATFYVFVFLSLCGYGALNLPNWMANRRRDMVLSFRFLIFRTRVDRWWFEVVLLLRAPLLALVNVALVDSAAMQVFALSIVLAGFLLLQTCYWPWKVPVVNLLDMLLSLDVMLIATVSPAEARADSGIVSALVLGLLLVMLGSIFLLTLFVMLNRSIMNDDENIFFNLGLLETPKELRERLRLFCGSFQRMDDELIEQAIRHFSVHDSRNITECLNMLNAELLPGAALVDRCGSIPSGRMLRLSQTMGNDSLEEAMAELRSRASRDTTDDPADEDPLDEVPSLEVMKERQDSFGSRTSRDVVALKC